MTRNSAPGRSAGPSKRLVEDPLSEEVLKGKFTYGTEVKADRKTDQLTFSGKPMKFDKAQTIDEPLAPKKKAAAAPKQLSGRQSGQAR